MEDKTIYDIIISPNAIIRVNLHEYKDKKYFTFRFWNKKINGEFVPGKVGMNIEFQYWGEFYRAFKTLEKEIIDNHIDEV